MAKTNPLHDNPRSKKVDAEQQEAKKGDVKDLNNDGEEWESYGASGARKGATRPYKKEDEEGDLDEEGWNKARDETQGEGLTTRDNKDPNDGKGWRREYWRKKQKPTS